MGKTMWWLTTLLPDPQSTTPPAASSSSTSNDEPRLSLAAGGGEGRRIPSGPTTTTTVTNLQYGSLDRQRGRPSAGSAAGRAARPSSSSYSHLVNKDDDPDDTRADGRWTSARTTRVVSVEEDPLRTTSATWAPPTPAAEGHISGTTTDPLETESSTSMYHDSTYGAATDEIVLFATPGHGGGWRLPSLRRLALVLSLYVNLAITLAKLITYLQTKSLSVLAALLDSVLDVVSQIVLNYTEHHSSMQRSSAHYPAGASRLEPIGVLTCAALMGMASFEVVKESITALWQQKSALAGEDRPTMASFYNMLAIVVVKLALLWLCQRGARKRIIRGGRDEEGGVEEDEEDGDDSAAASTLRAEKNSAPTVQVADPTLEALAQDHWNDMLSNTVAAVALLCALQRPSLWFLDPVGAILISLYIIYSWFLTGKEQIEQLTGKSAPDEFIEELTDMVANFDERVVVDQIRCYHFGPKFLVELEVVMPKETLLFESHDVGMELQYEIESREEVERCFVHIDYETRPYDEHVVSKVPELREKYRPRRKGSTQSL